MKLVLISDTHMLHDSITKHVPEGDVLIHSGDFTSRGYKVEAVRFLNWFASLPHKNKILIAGNHDFCCQEDAPWFKDEFSNTVPNGHYLDEESVVIDGIKFYGSPWTPWFYDWAFNLNECAEFNKELRAKVAKNRTDYSSVECWDKIPVDTNVLITHGPAFGTLDHLEDGANVGCPYLLQKIPQLNCNLKLHVFGHIHNAYGISSHSYSWPYPLGRGLHTYTAVNAAICTEEYRPKNKPIVVEI